MSGGDFKIKRYRKSNGKYVAMDASALSLEDDFGLYAIRLCLD